MIEIAICLGIIGFALVAIIGVLPTGLKVQRDNREETIVNQDAQVLIEAIRSGATNSGLDFLALYFDKIADSATTYLPGSGMNQFDTGMEIVGLLSRTNLPSTSSVRAFSGALSGRGVSAAAHDLAFAYELQTSVEQFTSVAVSANSTNIVTNAYELRLQFRWPLLPNGNTGRSRKVFRTLVAAESKLGGTTEITPLAFFVPQTYLP